MHTCFDIPARSGRHYRAVLALALISACFSPTPVLAEVASLPGGTCPLNSGGSSLLGTEWRLVSIYGNLVPTEMNINMKVRENELQGFSGCNDYTARFKRVGHTGFMITGAEKGQRSCRVLTPMIGGQSINVGDWEGSYIRTLQRAGSVQQEGNTLHFYNRSGEPSMVFAKEYGSL